MQRGKNDQKRMTDQVRRRKWNWLVHTLSRSDDNTAEQVLQWTWQRVQRKTHGKHLEKDLEKEMWTADFRYSWSTALLVVDTRMYAANGDAVSY